MKAWNTWVEQDVKEEKLRFFKKYLPCPEYFLMVLKLSVLFLFGAGASIPAGLIGIDQLTETFESETLDNELNEPLTQLCQNYEPFIVS